MCVCMTICPATGSLFIMMFNPSAPTARMMAGAILWRVRMSEVQLSGEMSSMLRLGIFGMTNVCPMLFGLISKKASVSSSS